MARTPVDQWDSLYVKGADTLKVLFASDDTPIEVGNGTNSADVTIFGNTSSDKVVWDASANLLSFQGDAAMVYGHTAKLTVSDGDGATNLIPGFQFLGTARADASVLIGGFNTTNDSTVAPMLGFLKGGDATIGAVATIVASGEILGEITAFGCDGVDYELFRNGIERCPYWGPCR